MKPPIRSGLAAAITIAVSISSAGLARAQRMGPSVVRPSAAPVHARPIATHAIVSHPKLARSTGTAARLTGFRESASASTFGDASFLSLQDLLNPVPGLGFDIPHLAAINRDLAIKAVIDPATQWQLAVTERLLRATRDVVPGPGFFLLDGGGAYVIPAESASSEPPQSQPQPQIIIVQQPPAAQPSSASSAPAVEPEGAPPLPDVGPFTLVLRNGTQIQAVAFTHVKDRIIYIIDDGSRRSMAASDLDSGATTFINEQLGTPLQLPL